MKRIFWILLMILGICTVPIPNSYACSCASTIDYFQAIKESDYAFTGTVTQIDNSDGPQKVYFDVSSVAKGAIEDGSFILENNNIIRHDEFTTQSSCDVGYQIGVTYNVFVYDNNNMNNGMCTTKPVGFLGVLNPVDYNLFYYVLPVGLIGIVGFVFLKKRK